MEFWPAGRINVDDIEVDRGLTGPRVVCPRLRRRRLRRR